MSKSSNLRNKKVLVVDDEPMLREVFADGLRLLGASVTEAGNGPDAFKACELTKFDLVVADIRIPGFSGVELMKKVKASSILSSQSPFVLVSGFADASTDQVLSLGASAWIGKPFELNQLNEVCERATLIYASERIFAMKLEAAKPELEECILRSDVFPEDCGQVGVRIRGASRGLALGERSSFEFCLSGFSFPQIVIKGVGQCVWREAQQGMGNEKFHYGMEILGFDADSAAAYLAASREFIFPGSGIPNLQLAAAA